MSTSDTTNILMRELIALDPTFTEKEAEVRTLITLLAEKKPHVTIDEVFVHDLRTRLTQPQKFPFRSPYHTVNWWALHLAPVGAVALLFLILMPNWLRYFEEQSVSTQEINLEERDASFKSAAPNAKLAPESGSEANDTTNMFSNLGQGGDTEPLSPNRLVVKDQVSGVSVVVESVALTEPGYVIIEAGVSGELVGVSPLLAPGITKNVPIYLRYPTHNNEHYWATLFHDDGNGVFSLDDDFPVFNIKTGSLHNVIFSVFPR